MPRLHRAAARRRMIRSDADDGGRKMLTPAEVRKRALRRKRVALHTGARREAPVEGFWEELFRSTAEPADPAPPPDPHERAEPSCR